MAKKRIPQLILEPVDCAANFLFLALVEYKRENYLCVIDNIRPNEIGAYVLDFAEQEGVNLQQFFRVVTHWFYSQSDKHPLSVELAKAGLTHWTGPMFKTFDTAYVSRIVGKGFAYDHMEKTKVRRRRVVPLPAGIEIVLKKTEGH